MDYHARLPRHRRPQTVIETQGFENAAARLFITQSAVSQRIKALESEYGEPVLVRALPYRPLRWVKNCWDI